MPPLTIQHFARKYGTDTFELIVRNAQAYPQVQSYQILLDEALADLRSVLAKELGA